MFKLCLILALSFVLASAKLGVAPLRSLNANNFDCFAQNDVSLVIRPVWSTWFGANKNFTQEYNLARAAGYKTLDAILSLGDAESPAEYIVAEVKKALPDDYNGTVWISVYPKWDGNWEERVIHLSQVIQTLEHNAIRAGIYSSAELWKATFDYADASSGWIRILSLTYIHQGQPNFDDYSSVAFAKCTAPAMKVYSALDVNFCGTVTSQIYFE